MYYAIYRTVKFSKKPLPFYDGEKVLVLGEIENSAGECAVVNSFGQIMFGLPLHYFKRDEYESGSADSQDDTRLPEREDTGRAYMRHE